MVQPPHESTPLVKDSNQGGLRAYLATLRLAATGGAGLLADGYDLQVVNLVMAIMEHLYSSKMGPGEKSFTATMTLVGVIVGQVTFGALADIIGRRLASITTATLTVVGAALSACVVDTPGFAIATQLALCRLLLGLGIGGEYPLSAAIGKEAVGELVWSRTQLLVFNMTLFNLGSVLQAVFGTLLLAASVPLSAAWRLALAGGLVPSLLAAFLRLGMAEPEAREQERRAAQAARGQGAAPAPAGYRANLASQVGARRGIMLGACASWFLFNFTAYGQGAFASIICDRLLGSSTESDLLLVKRNAVFALIMSAVSVLGCAIGFFISDHVSLRALQAVSFSLMALPLAVVAVLSTTQQGSVWLAVLYMFVVFMMSFVGITTYLVPTENFPASVRGTCMGVAAASGKFGGAVGTAIFPVLESRHGLRTVLMLSALLCLVGTLVTVLLTPGTRSLKDDDSGKEL
mmetsp:Transcript_105451/g.335710  ORF Transcript_105451/g.335710 Transcript_105451/m.335710 type:complete len:461 (+) Transcript_105451:62-1444(+)